MSDKQENNKDEVLHERMLHEIQAIHEYVEDIPEIKSTLGVIQDDIQEIKSDVSLLKQTAKVHSQDISSLKQI